MGICKELASFVASLKYEKLSGETVAFACECVLDGVGNIIAGTASEKAPKVRNGDFFENASMAETASRIAGGALASPETAAFANAVMLRALDLDDGHRFAMGHPGSVIVPTALSIGEALRLSGRETIAAIVAAYEIYARIGSAINPRSYSVLGFESTGTCGAIAAAALLARARGEEAETIADAMGIAALFSGGLIEYQNDGSSGKVLCPGWAAVNGFRAVQLAKTGFNGPRDIFEGKQGFFHAHGTDVADPQEVLRGLGQNFGILDTYFKVHSCMRGLHATIDGALSLRERHAPAPSEIAEIEVRTTSFVKRLDKPHPATLSEAQANVGFALSVALAYGEVSRRTMREGLTDPTVADLEKKIRVVNDERVSRYWEENPSHWVASNVAIRTRDGKEYEAWTPIARGERENPLSRGQLLDKFFAMTEDTAFFEKRQEIAEAVLHLDRCPDMKNFMHLLNG